MAKMKLNIKYFDEGSFDPTPFNALSSDYDGHVPTINQSFEANSDALEVLRNVAGSPRLSNETKGIITALNQGIDSTVDYFDSVKRWFSDVTESVGAVLSFFGLTPVSATVDRTVLNQINENFEGGKVGIRNFADAQTYISSIQDVISKLQNGLESITGDVQSANGALPDSVHSNLSTTIETSNDEAFNAFNNFHNALEHNLETITSQLQGAIDDMASSAAGGN